MVSNNTAIPTQFTPIFQDWKRCGLISILENVIFGWIGIFKSYIGLGGLSVFVFGFTKSISMTILIISAIAMLIIFASAFAAFWFYKFKIGVDGVEIKSGVLKRQHMNIPLDRVQQVTCNKPFYYKWFGDYVNVVLDTAGEAGTEGVIQAMSGADAETLKNFIDIEKWKKHNRDIGLAVDTITPMIDVKTEHDVLDINQNIITLMLHGLCRNKVIWFFVAGFGVYKNIESMIPAVLQKIGLNEVVTNAYLSGSVLQMTLFIAAMCVLYLGLILIFSAVSSVVKHFNYSLVSSADGYVCQQGLFTKVETRVKSKRLQWLLISKNLPERWFKKQSVKLCQYGESILVPSASVDQTNALLNSVMPHANLSSLEFKRVHFSYVVKKIVTHCAPFLVLSLIFEHVLDRSGWALGALIVAGLLGAGYVLRWYRYGYAQDVSFFYIREGRIDEKLYLIEKFKLQGTCYITSPFMDLFGLCSVKLSFSIKEFTLPYINKVEGVSMLNDGNAAVRNAKKNWM